MAYAKHGRQDASRSVADNTVPNVRMFSPRGHRLRVCGTAQQQRSERRIGAHQMPHSASGRYLPCARRAASAARDVRHRCNVDEIVFRASNATCTFAQRLRRLWTVNDFPSIRRRTSPHGPLRRWHPRLAASAGVLAYEDWVARLYYSSGAGK
jgi:hypothetical protein